MVIDTSAVVAVIRQEAEAERLARAMQHASARRMSAATLVEVTMVLEGYAGRPGGDDLDRFLHQARIEVVPFDAHQAALARVAWRQYGKGRHPAGLNLGDCFAYALSAATGEPLLFKGDDFAKTDVQVAPLPP